MRWAIAVALVACSSPRVRAPVPTAPPEGIALAIYGDGQRSYGVVDDRRTVEVTHGAIVLDRIDPAAALQSLVIEPLDAAPFAVVACMRERVDASPAALAQLAAARGERPRRIIVLRDLDERSVDRSVERFRFEDAKQMEPAILPDPTVLSPLVRCRVNARDGRHAVRVVHVTSALAFHASHDVTMTDPTRVRITTRYAIATPAWRTRATLTLYDGLPGDETPPRPLVTEPILLDGSTAIVAAAPRELPARLRTIYDGIKLDPDRADITPGDLVWGRESRRQVWRWLEIADARLAHGDLRAHVELPDQPARDLDIAADVREQTSQHVRFPLWIDEDLLGSRRRTVERADGVTIIERVLLTVSNLGTAPREVWIEERLRSAKRRSLGPSWPIRPALVDNIARTKLVLAPGETERVGFTISYEL